MDSPIHRRLRVAVEFEYPDWINDMPFGCLLEGPLRDAIPPNHQARFNAKANAVVHKWTMLQISGAELEVLCRDYARRYAGQAGVPQEVQLYVTCKIETFLMLARSLLDILSTCLSLWLRNSASIESFNDLRKRSDTPQWLREYAAAELAGRVGESPLTNIGWLTLLVSKSNNERSLRDFVTHQGIARFVIRIFDEEAGDIDLAFHPRASDSYCYSDVDINTKILRGIDAIAQLIERQAPATGLPSQA